MTEIGVAFTTLAGPWGPYHVAATERGVVAAEWGVSREAFEIGLTRRLGASLAESPEANAMLRRVRPSLEAMLAGEAVVGPTVPLDLADRPAFDRHVLLAVADVPWGRTASYVPCHRIIAADGTLGGYGGDGPADRAEALDRKRALLLREGVTVAFRHR